MAHQFNGVSCQFIVNNWSTIIEYITWSVLSQLAKRHPKKEKRKKKKEKRKKKNKKWKKLHFNCLFYKLMMKPFVDLSVTHTLLFSE